MSEEYFIGDKVVVTSDFASEDEYSEHMKEISDGSFFPVDAQIYLVDDMISEFSGKEVEIVDKGVYSDGSFYYKIREDDGCYRWARYMFEGGEPFTIAVDGIEGLI